MNPTRSFRSRLTAPAASALLFLLTMCRDDAGRPFLGPSADVEPPPPPVVFVGAGDIALCNNTRDEATALLLDAIPGTVFAIGDLVYDQGSASQFQNCYGPSWGRHKARTRPALGDKDYGLGNANAAFNYFGPANLPPPGYYSYDLGAWHIVVLNTNRSYTPISAGSAQLNWLHDDLQANTRPCLLAYFHHPRFFSSSAGTPANTNIRPIWEELYAHGVDVILNGNKHHYERFAPMDPAGNRDLARGIRQFIVGTGGGSGGSASQVAANSELIGRDYGVLKFTLDVGTYAWEFIPIAGRTFRDQGSGTCHNSGPTPPVADAGGPYRSEGTVGFDGAGSRDPDNDVPLTYAWTFGDGTTGTGVAPMHTYTADGLYPVVLRVTDTEGNVSSPVSTTATIGNIDPEVTAGADQTVHPNDAVQVTADFSDEGANDAPWTFRYSWGDGTPDDVGTTTDQSSTISREHAYAAAGTYTVRVTVTDKDGGSDFDEVTIQVRPPGVGVVLVGAGDIARCTQTNDEATSNLLDDIEGRVFTIGDNAHSSGTAAEYDCYNASWGRHKARTSPVPGDRDYSTAGAPAYFDYFGAAAGDPDKGYYSYDLGDWHVIALNSFVSMNAGSPQDLWLRADLAANDKPCVLAYFHHPRFASYGAGTSRGNVLPAWNALYQFGVEVVLSSHYLFYERSAPQTPAGVADPNGIRQFVVGTGGAPLNAIGTVMPNSEVRSATYGVLKLTLRPDGYDWEFVPVAGQTFQDAGSGFCH